MAGPENNIRAGLVPEYMASAGARAYNEGLGRFRGSVGVSGIVKLGLASREHFRK